MDTDPEIEMPGHEVAYISMTEGENAVYISETEDYGWLCSAVVWMYDDEGRGYALMNVDISMNDVMADRMDFLRVVLFAILLAMVAACVDPGAAGEPVCSQPHQSGSPCRSAVRCPTAAPVRGAPPPQGCAESPPEKMGRSVRPFPS